MPIIKKKFIKTHLDDFVSEDSILFFKILKLSPDFLKILVTKWKNENSYKNGAV